MSALKIVCKRKISRRLRKNRHSTYYNLITIRRWNYFRSIPTNVITAPYSDLNATDGRTLWYHCAVKIGTEIIADIIGITDILSQKYRYIVDF